MDEEQNTPPVDAKPTKTEADYKKEIAKLTAERDKAIKERDEANLKIREQADQKKEVDAFDALFGRTK